ncbi:hypothetical protein F5Y16DRAFT_348270 [Xylariaceae sp. FL0255]|nr:hypothetical protein F5Y16DRAFT_348270 [Xylariaceae sp. FL0255]
MLRRLWTGSRAPAHSFTSGLSKGPQSALPRRPLHTFTRPRIPPHGERRNYHHHHQHQQNGHKGPQVLQKTGIYCSVYTSIGYLVLNEDLDWHERLDLAIDKVQDVTLEPDFEKKWTKFIDLGHSLLDKFSGAEIEEHQGEIRLRDDSGWGGSNDQLRTRLYTAPDPDVEGGVLVLCLGILKDLDDTETYLSGGGGNRLTDCTEAIIPEMEYFARRLPESPRVRGAMIVLQEDGDWKSLYWDGKRWINIVYLEWQTAESMGLVRVKDEE